MRTMAPPPHSRRGRRRSPSSRPSPPSARRRHRLSSPSWTKGRRRTRRSEGTAVSPRRARRTRCGFWPMSRSFRWFPHPTSCVATPSSSTPSSPPTRRPSWPRGLDRRRSGSGRSLPRRGWPRSRAAAPCAGAERLGCPGWPGERGDHDAGQPAARRCRRAEPDRGAPGRGGARSRDGGPPTRAGRRTARRLHREAGARGRRRRAPAERGQRDAFGDGGDDRAAPLTLPAIGRTGRTR